MTRKLYYKDQYMGKFTASIVSAIEKDGEYHVVLDQTAFYPEGGGQPSDKGVIGDINVKYVYSEKDQVFHVIDKLPVEQKEIDCRLNWERRFDHMQQHTGEHILSAIFKKKYNAENVGFHLGDDYVSIDLDQNFSEEEIIAAEREANNAIYDNLPIEAIYPDREEIKKMDLRKEPTVKGKIRIVKIGELDYSPCGGTHLSSTGQVGLIKIIDFSKYKGGTRVKFLCGIRALQDYQFKNSVIKELKQKLTVREEEILNEVSNIRGELVEKDKEINELKNSLLNYKAKELLNVAEEVKGIKIITKVFDNLNFNEIKVLSDRLTAEKKVIVIVGQKDQSAARLILSRSEDIEKLDMNKIIISPLELIDGNGGGNTVTAQGGGSRKDNIEQAVKKAYNLIVEKIT